MLALTAEGRVIPPAASLGPSSPPVAPNIKKQNSEKARMDMGAGISKVLGVPDMVPVHMPFLQPVLGQLLALTLEEFSPTKYR